MSLRTTVAVLGVFLLPAAAGAANGPALRTHPLAAVPFALMLAAIALLPLIAGRWWHRNRSKALVAAILASPTAIYVAACNGGPSALLHEVETYTSFIVLLAALYAVSGGVVVRGGRRNSTWANVAILATGAILANLIGTTGASMVLVRPILRINASRPRRTHVAAFFIFVVSNTGGLLTPLGDPPLFLGFLQGVEFTWTLRLWPQWLLVNAAVIGAFAAWDRLAIRADRRDTRSSRMPLSDTPTASGPLEPIRLEGCGLNVPLMLGVIGAVVAKKYVPFPIAELAMIGLAALSLHLTPRRHREANRFTWAPMAEVAILFAGIFATMVPALALLDERRATFGVDRPWEYFWLTGILSSLLDNAPTYLTMASLAADGNGLAALAADRPDVLAAISCGAVFMGANSYVGNGPNFMVKAIAEESGYDMPSFGGYALRAAAILLPVYAVVTIAFFRG